MKIVILSGGSGNDALIKGLKKFYRDADIKVIVNAYDNGKSTGVCRAVTDTLGVSDIRKNHERMYKAVYGDKSDSNVLEFYKNRYDFQKGNEETEIKALLEKWNMADLKPYVEHFFANPKAHDFVYHDFSVSNIVYAQMYKEMGYEATNAYFCKRFGIDDFVVLNSFDNIFIKAKTQSGHVIEDEGETVFWNNSKDKIVGTIYEKGKGESFGLNPKAVDLVKNADLLVISTGTFWSSIQPTVEYLGFSKYINRSGARKIWAMNNEEDGDSWGVNNLELLEHMEKSGLDLNQFTILTNADARPSMKLQSKKYHFVEIPMGNINGKHDGDKFARSLLQVYLRLGRLEDYDKILLDFDDTIWARKNEVNLQECSKENVALIKKFLKDKAVIISGNSYESIKSKLDKAGFTNFDIDIWADANSTLFNNGKVVDFLDEFALDGKAKKYVDELARDFDLKIVPFGHRTVNWKIKPLSQLERKLLTEVINTRYPSAFKACMTGTTTVDILSINNSKEKIFKHCHFDKLRTLYIGDEIDNGNDIAIANLCTKAVQVADVFETNVIIKLLLGE